MSADLTTWTTVDPDTDTADLAAELAAAGIVWDNLTPDRRDAHTVICEDCGAGPGAPCVYLDGELAGPCVRRVAAFRLARMRRHAAADELTHRSAVYVAYATEARRRARGTDPAWLAAMDADSAAATAFGAASRATRAGLDHALTLADAAHRYAEISRKVYAAALDADPHPARIVTIDGEVYAL